MSKKNLSFEVVVFPPGNYLGKVEIEVRPYNPEGWNSHFGTTLAKMKWHISNEKAGDIWGFEMSASYSHLADFQESTKVSRRILKKISDNADSSPEGVIGILNTMAVEVISDRREGKLIPVKEVKGPEWHRYIDDYHNLGREHCTYDAMARDEVEAQAAIMLETAQRDKVWCKMFVDAGMPVMVPSRSDAPDARLGIEKINALKEKGNENGLD